MLEKWKKNRIAVIIAVILLLIIVGVVIWIVAGNDGKEHGKSDINIETEKDKKDDVKEEVAGDEGLQVLEDDKTATEESIDAAGSWEDTTDNKTEKGNEAGKNDNVDSEHQGEDDIKKNDVLEDDKSWTPPL